MTEHVDFSAYMVVIQPLSEEDGGGFVAYVPDLVGCVSDGETPEAALQDVRKAMAEWVALQRQLGRDIPLPTTPQARPQASASTPSQRRKLKSAKDGRTAFWPIHPDLKLAANTKENFC